MVTISLRQLLEQRQEYTLLWPGGEGTMPPRVAQAHRSLIMEIKAAGKRNQGTLPGIDMHPVAPEGQGVLL